MYIPLPNGEHLLTFSDKTGTFKRTNSLHEAEILLRLERSLFLGRLQRIREKLCDKLLSFHDASASQKLKAPRMISMILKEGSRAISGGDILTTLREEERQLVTEHSPIRTPISLESFLPQILETLSPLLKERQVSIQIEPLGNWLPCVVVTPFLDLMMYVLGYALFHMKPGQNITLSLAFQKKQLALYVKAPFSPQAESSLQKEYPQFYPWGLSCQLMGNVAAVSGCHLTFQGIRQKFFCAKITFREYRVRSSVSSPKALNQNLIQVGKTS
jgi:hypothetical protein